MIRLVASPLVLRITGMFFLSSVSFWLRFGIMLASLLYHFGIVLAMPPNPHPLAIPLHPTLQANL